MKSNVYSGDESVVGGNSDLFPTNLGWRGHTPANSRSFEGHLFYRRQTSTVAYLQRTIQSVGSSTGAKPIFFRLNILFGSFGNEPMQSCFVWRVVLSLASSVSASSVYSCPSDSFDHRNFISCQYMHQYP